MIQQSLQKDGVHFYTHQSNQLIYNTIRNEAAPSCSANKIADHPEDLTAWKQSLKSLFGNPAQKSQGIQRAIGSRQSGKAVYQTADKLVQKALQSGAGYVSGGRSYKLCDPIRHAKGFDGPGFATWLYQSMFSGGSGVDQDGPVLMTYHSQAIQNPSSFIDDCGCIDDCGWRHLGLMDKHAWQTWLDEAGIYTEQFHWSHMEIDDKVFSPGSLVVYYDNNGVITNMLIYSGKFYMGRDWLVGAAVTEKHGTRFGHIAMDDLNKVVLGSTYRVHAFEQPGK